VIAIQFLQSFFCKYKCELSPKQGFVFSSSEERKDKQSLKEDPFLSVPSHLAKIQNLYTEADFSFDRPLYRIIVNAVSIMFWLDNFLSEALSTLIYFYLCLNIVIYIVFI